jgi:hypothetical protein
MNLIFIFHIIFLMFFNINMYCNFSKIEKLNSELINLSNKIIVPNHDIYDEDAYNEDKFNKIDSKNLFDFLKKFYSVYKQLDKYDDYLSLNEEQAEKITNIVFDILNIYKEVKKKVEYFLTNEKKEIDAFDGKKSVDSTEIWSRQYDYENTLIEYFKKKEKNYDESVENSFLTKIGKGIKKFFTGGGFSEYKEKIENDFVNSDKIFESIKNKISELKIYLYNLKQKPVNDLKKDNFALKKYGAGQSQSVVVINQDLKKEDEKTKDKKNDKQSDSNKKDKDIGEKIVGDEEKKLEPKNVNEKIDASIVKLVQEKTYFNDAQKENENKKTDIDDEKKRDIDDSVEMIFAKTNEMDPEKIYQKIESDPELKRRFENMSPEQKEIFKKKIKDLISKKIESVKNGNFSNEKVKAIYNENKQKNSFVSIDSINYESIVNELGLSRSFFDGTSANKQEKIKVDITDEDKKNFVEKAKNRTLVTIKQQIKKDPSKKRKLEKLLKLKKIADKKNIKLKDLIEKIKNNKEQEEFEIDNDEAEERDEYLDLNAENEFEDGDEDEDDVFDK